MCSGWISRTSPLQTPKNAVAWLDFEDGIYGKANVLGVCHSVFVVSQ